MLRNLRLLQDCKSQVMLNISGSPSILHSKAHGKKINCAENEKGRKNIGESTKRRILALKIKDCFNFSECEAMSFVDKNQELWQASKLRVTRTIEYLIKNNVTTKTIIENPWLMAVPLYDLQNKLEAIEKISTTRDINHFLPLIRISPKYFTQILLTMQKDEKKFSEGNRIYYISSRLEVEEILVSKYFASHLFMFYIPAEKIKEKLNVMLEFGITPLSILRDLWSFENSVVKITDRLERCQRAGTPILRPWMIRCTENNLEKALKLSEERKKLLGDRTFVNYLSQRLGRDSEQIENLIEKHDFLKKVCVKKVKNVLDYLLEKEKIDPVTVMSSIRIFRHSLVTTKKRITELKLLGVPPSSLACICYAKADYNKYLEKCRNSRIKRNMTDSEPPEKIFIL